LNWLPGVSKCLLRIGDVRLGSNDVLINSEVWNGVILYLLFLTPAIGQDPSMSSDVLGLVKGSMGILDIIIKTEVWHLIIQRVCSISSFTFVGTSSARAHWVGFSLGIELNSREIFV